MSSIVGEHRDRSGIGGRFFEECWAVRRRGRWARGGRHEVSVLLANTQDVAGLRDGDRLVSTVQGPAGVGRAGLVEGQLAVDSRQTVDEVMQGGLREGEGESIINMEVGDCVVRVAGGTTRVYALVRGGLGKAEAEHGGRKVLVESAVDLFEAVQAPKYGLELAGERADVVGEAHEYWDL